MIKVRINFDMDGTIADLYGVENWLEYLINGDTTPYDIAKPMIRFNTLARMLNKLQKEGYQIGIISWLSKSGTPEYNALVRESKLNWLAKHLPSVKWDNIAIIPYGTPKEEYAESAFDVLFDDEIHNRENWTGKAFDVENIIEVLKTF